MRGILANTDFGLEMSSRDEKRRNWFGLAELVVC